jgi:hypothetical protein
VEFTLLPRLVQPDQNNCENRSHCAITILDA